MSFKFKCTPVHNVNSAYDMSDKTNQLLGLAVKRNIQFLNNAVAEIQERIESLDVWTDKQKADTKKGA